MVGSEDGPAPLAEMLLFQLRSFGFHHVDASRYTSNNTAKFVVLLSLFEAAIVSDASADLIATNRALWTRERCGKCEAALGRNP